VIGSNGTLTGYAGGLDLKKKLLDWEQAVAGHPVNAQGALPGFAA
jgi:hypothetical protein